MKIQLNYDRPAQVPADLLVVILDDEYKLHDLAGSPLEATVRRVQSDLDNKKLKTEYFAQLEIKGGPKNLLVYSTGSNKSHNVWETVKTFIAKSLRFAQDRGMDRVAVVLNT